MHTRIDAYLHMSNSKRTDRVRGSDVLADDRDGAPKLTGNLDSFAATLPGVDSGRPRRDPLPPPPPPETWLALAERSRAT